MTQHKAIKIIKNNWILFFILLQPLLDVLAFWTQSEAGTASGYIRLCMMVSIYLYALIKKPSRGFAAASLCIAFVFGAHILNGFRVGYINFISDVKYVARVAYLPVITISLSVLADNEEKQKQIIRGLYVSAALTAAVILLSFATDTYTPTYIVENIGISGWVIDSNRCCHSDILSSLAIFTAYGAIRNTGSWLALLPPLLIFVTMITNATTACYLTLLAVTIGFPVFMVFRFFVVKKKENRAMHILIAEFVLLFVIAVAIYPVTPRCKMENLKHASYSDHEQKFAQEMSDLGYDIYSMSLDEKLNDPVVHERISQYYTKFICSSVESMRDRFGVDRVIKALNGTVSGEILGDTRNMKRLNASFIMEDSDFLTHLTGFEYGQFWNDYEDLENDWHAIFYYYGYIGIAVYIFAICLLAFRIVRLLVRDFQGSLTVLNFTLLLCFMIQLGLAGFSGALLRLPNASIYLALTIAQIWYQTGKPRLGNSSF